MDTVCTDFSERLLVPFLPICVHLCSSVALIASPRLDFLRCAKAETVRRLQECQGDGQGVGGVRRGRFG